MYRSLELQDKLRKSGVFNEEDIYNDFMLYAQEVRDELQVYLYMQENNIGTNETEYWLARFHAMQRQCLFSQIAQLIAKVKKIPGIDINCIQKYQTKLIKDLQFIICEPVSGRRKAQSFYIDQISNIHPQKRRIGNIEVFVDEDCRKNYKLPDYARYIEKEKKDYYEMELQFNRRMQKDKPYSFLAKNQLQLIELAEQFLLKNGRKSMEARKSMQVQRMSNKMNTSRRQTLKEQDFNTPKCNPPNTINYSNNKLSRVQSRDSIEILKQIRQKQTTEHKSPKFGEKERQVHNQGEKKQHNNSNSVIEHCRGINFLEKNKQEDLCFSFRKIRVSVSEKKQKQRNRVKKQPSVDNAFIMYSFSKESKNQQPSCVQFVNKQDFELALLINQIQQEKYQKIDSKTFSSQIDSNQENNFYQSGCIIRNPQRQPLQDLLLSPNYQKYDLEDLIRENEEHICTSVDKLPDLHCHSEQKQKLSPVYMFRSERKRLSNITEQMSYSSNSRKKHLSRK